MKPKKTYTDEDMSKILSAHADGLLVVGGEDYFFNNQCCINQCVFNEPNRMRASHGYGLLAKVMAAKFDTNYKENMTYEELIEMIEKTEKFVSDLEKKYEKI